MTMLRFKQSVNRPNATLFRDTKHTAEAIADHHWSTKPLLVIDLSRKIGE